MYIFCFCYSLSTCINDDISFLWPGLNLMGVKNDIFWSEIESGFKEPGSTPPPGIPRSTPEYSWEDIP